MNIINFKKEFEKNYKISCESIDFNIYKVIGDYIYIYERDRKNNLTIYKFNILTEEIEDVCRIKNNSDAGKYYIAIEYIYDDCIFYSYELDIKMPPA